MYSRNKPRPIYLKDYKKPSYSIEEIELLVHLHSQRTRVSSKMTLYRTTEGPLVLNGENMTLLSVKLDGKTLAAEEYRLDSSTLTLLNPPSHCTLEIENEINPADNTALEGLYKSGSTFCTQNEPEGFRKITFFIDRPDVMAKYTTTIIADKQSYPILLSNGNEVGRGDLPENKHWVKWHDPFPKPSYLFAMVAGDFDCLSGTHITRSGRQVDLRFYCEKGKSYKCQHALESLKRAMRWDEEVFGLEYDLNIYMIVAVDFFNMGAMENKGLNIFNTRCVLVDPATATDDNFHLVEGIIAHEYFHNWTGNRVTCRDWFQLTLKEGLTVFRDQEFSADMHSKAVKRIEEVRALRDRQFEEDCSPTRHPIKPKSYIQINNFYTSTVYLKGAEVIRMIHTLIGKDAFRRGMDRYFELYDGQAVTTEDFVYAMEQGSGKDLSQFCRWYDQEGTPEVKVHFHHDVHLKRFSLTVEQSSSADEPPLHFPLMIGLLSPEGKEMPLKKGGLLEITRSKETFVFDNIATPPLPSLNRHFSAPIKIHAPYTLEDYRHLMKHDNDLFCRWEAGQELATLLMLEQIQAGDNGRPLSVNEGYLEAFGHLLKNESIDNSWKAMALMLPTEGMLAQRQPCIAIERTHQTREFFAEQLALYHKETFFSLYQQLNSVEPYSLSTEAVGRRSLKNLCLYYLVLTRDEICLKLCINQFNDAAHMTDEIAALTYLANSDCDYREEALKRFYYKWKEDTLVMNKWLAIQAGSKIRGTFDHVQKLAENPVFDLHIPNLVRSLFVTYTQNAVHFHLINGAGYGYIADQILKLDKINPHTAAYLAQAYKKLGQLDSYRQKAMKQQLEKILATPNLSSHVFEIVSKCLGKA